MKTLLSQLLKAGGVCLALLLSFHGMLCTPAWADGGDQTLTIQNVPLEPGDIINLEGGAATTNPVTGPLADEYGHTALYLGIVNGEKKFLDFTTRKRNYQNDPYHGRILNEEQFLAESLKSHHDTMHVYRLNNASIRHPQEFINTALDLAEHGHWALPRDCTAAATKVLAAGTGQKVSEWRPDAIGGIDSPFSLASPVTIDIKSALADARAVPDHGAIVGTWTGEGHSSDGQSFNLMLQLDSVSGGSESLSWGGGGCSGDLSGGPSVQGRYSYSLTITSGRWTPEDGGCLDGTVVLVLGSEGIASYSWSSGSYSSNATLYKQ